MRHPAKYTDSFLPVFAKILEGRESVLDPMAGTGKIARIKEYGYHGKITCNDIEEDWQRGETYPVDEWHFTDAANMVWASDECFDAICTSPTYGNRMADAFVSKDGTQRITYFHYLGRPLTDGNTGCMQYGDKYKRKHEAIWRECARVLAKGGTMIVNVSNHIRQGKIIDVVSWHKNIISGLGLRLVDEILVDTPRMGFGRNGNMRVPAESILVFQKLRKYYGNED